MAQQDDYPRPDFRRSSLNWYSLNGPWDFAFDDADLGLDQGWQRSGLSTSGASKRTIQVPFVFQCEASGINERGVHEVLWYEKDFEDIRSESQSKLGHHLVLRFGAVDYAAKVWVDGQFVGEHRGGHVPFDIDITDAVRTTNATGDRRGRLTIRVFDSAHDLTQPRGKQYWGPKPESIFYTPSSGMWQSVWLESVPRLRIADSSRGTILRSDDIESSLIDARIAVQGRRAREPCSVQVQVSLSGVVVSTGERVNILDHEDFARFSATTRLSAEHLEQLPPEFFESAPRADKRCWKNGVALWSPECPTLYDIRVRLFDKDSNLVDEVNTTTGMRSINWQTGDQTLRLNGQPYFHALLLDQGYWPDTLMTPPSQAALKRDIELSKVMGFNGCRKHQKVEDPAFFYWADKLGFLVWGEMANGYNFSVDYVDRFNEEWMAMVKRDINHPCIVAWTPVNESWGYPDLGGNARQRDHIRSLYYMTKTLDPSRPINDNCGWEHVVTDLSTFHDYADEKGMAERCASVQSILGRGRSMFLGEIHGPGSTHDEGSRNRRGAPFLCTEFGGVNIAASSDGDRKENWGYTTAKDSADLLKRVERIITATVKTGHVCGIVWTQTTDIEQEQNGLYTWDRREKLPAKEMKAIVERAKETYYEQRQ